MDETNTVKGSFSDYLFNCDWDMMTSTTKGSNQEFESFEDREHVFSQILTEMPRRERHSECRAQFE